MKKILSASALVITLFNSSTQVFAGGHVSEMAISKGGIHVDECAQKMDKGISEWQNLMNVNKNYKVKS